MLGDSSIVIIIWVGFAIFSLLSILFYLGKGTSLIAGYNTASDAKKDKYDKKKLSIVMGRRESGSAWPQSQGRPRERA